MTDIGGSHLSVLCDMGGVAIYIIEDGRSSPTGPLLHGRAIDKFANLLVEGWNRRDEGPWRSDRIYNRYGTAWVSLAIGDDSDAVLILTGERKLTPKGCWIDEPAELSDLLDVLSRAEG